MEDVIDVLSHLVSSREGGVDLSFDAGKVVVTAKASPPVREGWI